MSFRDLKQKNKNTSLQKTLTADEFIADAEKYAQGEEALVGHKVNNLSLQDAIDSAKAQIKEDSRQASKEKGEASKPFRHATFTLSEEAIAQLNHLAKESKLAKSHILRILIDELCHVEPSEKLTKLLGSKIS